MGLQFCNFPAGESLLRMGLNPTLAHWKGEGRQKCSAMLVFLGGKPPNSAKPRATAMIIAQMSVQSKLQQDPLLSPRGRRGCLEMVKIAWELLTTFNCWQLLSSSG